MLFPRVYETSADVLATLKLYVDDQISLMRARAMLQISGLLSFVLLSIFLIIAASVFFLFIAIAFGIWIGQRLGSISLGFLCSAGLWVVIMGIFYYFRTGLFIDPMLRRLYRFSKEARKQTAERAEDAPYRNTEALEQYQQELEQKLRHEEAFIAKRIDGLRNDASNDLIESALGVLMKASSLSLLRGLKDAFRKRTNK
ncbi:MAG: hypothetical protein CSA97_02185 [Bacteroidetes bacterium]|nr:MAG: hypothetical protein CSA97_02185 [Bacteroidota bacterium]